MAEDRPNSLAQDTRRLKRWRFAVGWAVVLVALAGFCLVSLGFIARSRPALVSVEFLGAVNGSEGPNRFAFRITNAHRRAIRFSYVPEVKTANGWPIDNLMKMNGFTSPLPALNTDLGAGQVTVISVAMPAAKPSRLLVGYSKETFKRDEIGFKMRQRLYGWGWDWIAERIPSEKYHVYFVCSPALGEKD